MSELEINFFKKCHQFIRFSFLEIMYILQYTILFETEKIHFLVSFVFSGAYFFVSNTDFIIHSGGRSGKSWSSPRLSARTQQSNMETIFFGTIVSIVPFFTLFDTKKNHFKHNTDIGLWQECFTAPNLLLTSSLE